MKELRIERIKAEQGTFEEDGREVYSMYREYEVTADGEKVYTVRYNLRKIGDYQSEDIAVLRNHEKEYLQDIYFEQANKWSGLEKSRFEIQTTAYGSKTVEEIDKVIEGYEIAKALVTELTDMFID